jgi:hypothetical protein
MFRQPDDVEVEILLACGFEYYLCSIIMNLGAQHHGI